MSSMYFNSASRRLSASHASIRAALELVQRIPRWNPAITSIVPSSSGDPDEFAIRCLGWIPGTLIADTASPVIRMSISIPGLKELSSWKLAPSSSGTVVHHEIRQHGPLTAVIGAREAARVPGKRLARLEAHLRSESSMR